MKYKVGDRVVLTETPPYIREGLLVGKIGHVAQISPSMRLNGVPCPCRIAFEDGDEVWCHKSGLALAVDLPSVEEALAGLTELLASSR